MSGLANGGLDQGNLGCRRKRCRRYRFATAVQNHGGLAGWLGSERPARLQRDTDHLGMDMAWTICSSWRRLEPTHVGCYQLRSLPLPYQALTLSPIPKDSQAFPWFHITFEKIKSAKTQRTPGLMPDGQLI
jgi:hypothetical protein